jgi:hypothetical protein
MRSMRPARSVLRRRTRNHPIQEVEARVALSGDRRRLLREYNRPHIPIFSKSTGPNIAHAHEMFLEAEPLEGSAFTKASGNKHNRHSRPDAILCCR